MHATTPSLRLRIAVIMALCVLATLTSGLYDASTLPGSGSFDSTRWFDHSQPSPPLSHETALWNSLGQLVQDLPDNRAQGETDADVAGVNAAIDGAGRGWNDYAVGHAPVSNRPATLLEQLDATASQLQRHARDTAHAVSTSLRAVVDRFNAAADQLAAPADQNAAASTHLPGETGDTRPPTSRIATR